MTPSGRDIWITSRCKMARFDNALAFSSEFRVIWIGRMSANPSRDGLWG